MSGNHKRKTRDQKRKWRYNSTVNLIMFLTKLKFNSAKRQNVVSHNTYGVRKIWDYVCRYDSWLRRLNF